MVYTSGSTGKPKGAMVDTQPIAARPIARQRPMTNVLLWVTQLSNAVFRQRIGGLFLAPDPFVVVSWLPLAHSFDRENCLTTVSGGGRIAFHTGPVSSIFDTLQLVRPTSFSSTPRLWNMLWQQFSDALAIKLEANPTADVNRHV